MPLWGWMLIVVALVALVAAAMKKLIDLRFQELEDDVLGGKTPE